VFEIENNNIRSNEESVVETNPLCDKKEKVGEYVMDSMPNRPETVMSNDELDDIDIDNGSPNRPDLDEEYQFENDNVNDNVNDIDQN